MFDNVIVGVNGLEGGRDAIALAVELLSPGGRLTFAFIYHVDPPMWLGLGAGYDEARREQALETLEKAAHDMEVDARLCRVGSTSVGRGLHELAEYEAADLVVVGSSRRGLVGRVLLGDDTRAALNGAPCPIAIAPAGYAEQPHLLREIGVGYNGSPESEQALIVARAIANEHRARLSAFEAVSIPAIALSAGPAPVDEWMQELLDDALRRVSALGDVEPHAVYGQACEELAMFSASVDLLVVGSRGYGPVGRLIHGGTSQELARVARCPLLVLTRAGHDTHGRDEAVVADPISLVQDS
ncbi:MAG: universal stress protein [Solirubrobacteraceae bacterium]